MKLLRNAFGGDSWGRIETSVRSEGSLTFMEKSKACVRW